MMAAGNHLKGQRQSRVALSLSVDPGPSLFICCLSLSLCLHLWCVRRSRRHDPAADVGSFAYAVRCNMQHTRGWGHGSNLFPPGCRAPISLQTGLRPNHLANVNNTADSKWRPKWSRTGFRLRPIKIDSCSQRLPQPPFFGTINLGQQIWMVNPIPSFFLSFFPSFFLSISWILFLNCWLTRCICLLAAHRAERAGFTPSPLDAYWLTFPFRNG